MNKNFYMNIVEHYKINIAVIFIDDQIWLTWLALVLLAAVFVFAVSITGFFNTCCRPANESGEKKSNKYWLYSAMFFYSIPAP